MEPMLHMRGKTGRPRPGARFPSGRTGMMILLVVGALLAGLALAAGCGYGNEVGDAGSVSTTSSQDQGTGSTTTTAPADATTTTSLADGGEDADGETLTITVYFSRDTKMAAAHRTIPHTEEVGAAAMRALLEGPTEKEDEAGLYQAIPEGTKFLGLNIEDGIATVDLSKEYASGGGSTAIMTRLAQVVFTLTQFDTVNGVEFKLDGEPIEVFSGEGFVLDHPLDRNDYIEAAAPAILVESPTVGDEVSSPMRVWGSANTFEASFRLNIVDWDGRIIADETVQATSGSGTRGTFDVTVPFSVDRDQRGALIVFEESARDGSPTNVVEIPLRLLSD